MSPLASLRDVLLVARFDLLRAMRTWWALALFLLYALATTGAAWSFSGLVWAMESALAKQLHVPQTERPGAMLQQLVESDSFRSVLESMVGSDAAAEQLLQVPVLAIFNLWFAFAAMPFFAAMASSECLSGDLASRAIRYEALRTGRLELVAGKYLAQLVLTGIATVLSVVGVLAVGLGWMVGNDPIELTGWLLWLSLRAWFFSMPFVGIGVATTQITTWPMLSRVLALMATSGTWAAYVGILWMEDTRAAFLADLLVQVLPQGWMHQMWEPVGWVVPAVVCAVLGPVFALVGYVRFATRDL